MAATPIRFVQLSDTHLLADESAALLGVTTQKSFEAVLQLLQHEKGRIDFIVHTGDLSQDGSEASYARFADLMQSLQVPVYCVPGNHDDADMMQRVFPRHQVEYGFPLVLDNWQLILLNSQKPGAVEGYLDALEKKQLQDSLEMHPKHHAITFFHHHPIPVGSVWLDRLGLTNAEEFWTIILRYPQVAGVFFGHVHQESFHLVKDIPAYSVPSTCIQFKRGQAEFGLEKLPPGYRVIELHEDGKIVTDVHRTKEYVGVFDEAAKGY